MRIEVEENYSRKEDEAESGGSLNNVICEDEASCDRYIQGTLCLFPSLYFLRVGGRPFQTVACRGTLGLLGSFCYRGGNWEEVATLLFLRPSTAAADTAERKKVGSEKEEGRGNFGEDISYSGQIPLFPSFPLPLPFAPHTPTNWERIHHAALPSIDEAFGKKK